MGRNNLSGAWGEALAAEYLREKGYRICSSGYGCRFGEIDLIAEKGRFLAFVEVKLRKSADFGRAGEYVDQKKRQKLRTTAEFYLAEHPSEGLQPRFDVAELYAPQGMATREPEFHYWENAF